MEKQYTTVIFDLDGTLMDTLQDIANSANYTLQKFNLPIRSIEEIRSFVGCGIRKLLIDIFLVAANEANVLYAESMIDDALPVFRTHYTAHCKDCTKPYDGIFELLENLKNAGFKMAIVSNKPQRDVEILHKEYFEKWIDVALGENEVAGIRRKPYPDMVWKAIDMLCEERKKCVYVGDSETDFSTAKNSGIDCISVLWGFRTEEFLRKIGAQTFAYLPTDILSIVSSSK